MTTCLQLSVMPTPNCILGIGMLGVSRNMLTSTHDDQYPSLEAGCWKCQELVAHITISASAGEAGGCLVKDEDFWNCTMFPGYKICLKMRI